METSFKIKDARKAKQQDVIKAMDIYIRNVDSGSDTDTREIYNYINNKYTENRIMFFYVLYHNGNVEGYAEYAYLPSNSTLVIDYLCTNSRNHTYFYNYYHLILENIRESLNKQLKHIKYIITELSLRKDKNILIDKDSNYFRKLLSIEDYILLKLPYYQPNLNISYVNETMEFNIAIKVLNGNSELVINKEFYMNLIDELYNEHYKQWYYHSYTQDKVDNYINRLRVAIYDSLPNREEFQRIDVVNCSLFEEGVCKQITPDNITISKIRKYKRMLFLKLTFWFAFGILTLILCILQLIPKYSSISIGIITAASSFLSIITGIMAIIQYFKS